MADPRETTAPHDRDLVRRLDAVLALNRHDPVCHVPRDLLMELRARVLWEIVSADTPIPVSTTPPPHRIELDDGCTMDDTEPMVDEVAGFGDYHAEMLSDSTMYLLLGPSTFTIWAKRGELYFRHDFTEKANEPAGISRQRTPE
ncbi:MAG: hypothetical protein ACR652_24495 [Methylocystis sp.]|uniref:hypothetical protein n=1 Tax=Methylocystis sp. TaxID=1911079 RepID=UPI003DA3D721